MQETTIIRTAIARDGYWSPLKISKTGRYNMYTDCIIRCKTRGYAVVRICNPYGGQPHFAVSTKKTITSFHTRGLDVVKAQSILPARGISVAGCMEFLKGGEHSCN